MSGHKMTWCVRGGLAWPGTPRWIPRSCRSECTIPQKKGHQRARMDHKLCKDRKNTISGSVQSGHSTVFDSPGDMINLCAVKTVKTYAKNLLFNIFQREFLLKWIWVIQDILKKKVVSIIPDDSVSTDPRSSSQVIFTNYWIWYIKKLTSHFHFLLKKQPH